MQVIGNSPPLLSQVIMVVLPSPPPMPPVVTGLTAGLTGLVAAEEPLPRLIGLAGATGLCPVKLTAPEADEPPELPPPVLEPPLF